MYVVTYGPQGQHRKHFESEDAALDFAFDVDGHVTDIGEQPEPCEDADHHFNGPNRG
jgi:hypothetical protein